MIKYSCPRPEDKKYNYPLAFLYIPCDSENPKKELLVLFVSLSTGIALVNKECTSASLNEVTSYISHTDRNAWKAVDLSIRHN